MKKNILKIVGYAVVGGAVLMVAYSLLIGVPTIRQDQAFATPTQKSLTGVLISVSPDTLVVDVQTPRFGTTSVAVGSTTTVTKDTPFSKEELQAAYVEYQKRQAQAGGKPFEMPSSMKVETRALRDLQPKDVVLITLTLDSSKDHFAAERIEILPSDTALPVMPSPANAVAPL